MTFSKKNLQVCEEKIFRVDFQEANSAGFFGLSRKLAMPNCCPDLQLQILCGLPAEVLTR